jgi:hypothetical protein
MTVKTPLIKYSRKFLFPLTLILSPKGRGKGEGVSSIGSRRAVLIAVIFSIGFLLTQDGGAAQDKGVKFTIASDKEEYKKDESISIDFKLKNTGNKAIYVNARFYIIPEDDAKKNGEICFSVISPAGEKLPCKVSYETGLPKTDYFVLLKPGEEIGAERKPVINYYFDFSGPGSYKITAAYQNKYGAEVGLDAFKGKIVSQPIIIKRVE